MQCCSTNVIILGVQHLNAPASGHTGDCCTIYFLVSFLSSTFLYILFYKMIRHYCCLIQCNFQWPSEGIHSNQPWMVLGLLVSISLQWSVHCCTPFVNVTHISIVFSCFTVQCSLSHIWPCPAALHQGEFTTAKPKTFSNFWYKSFFFFFKGGNFHGI